MVPVMPGQSMLMVPTTRREERWARRAERRAHRYERRQGRVQKSFISSLTSSMKGGTVAEVGTVVDIAVEAIEPAPIPSRHILSQGNCDSHFLLCHFSYPSQASPEITVRS